MATATATKAARKAAQAQPKAKAVAKPAVEAPKRTRKQAEPAPEPQPLSKNQQGHVIQAAMTAATNAKRPMTVEQLAAQTGYSVARVQEHVTWEIERGRSKLNGKQQVLVLSQPVYRNVG
jgi:transcriptional regulator GlxA family with amidase domain